MEAATNYLYCANGDCQQRNPNHHRFCQACNTPLVRRYLWVIGNPLPPLTVGTKVGDMVPQGSDALNPSKGQRYAVITPRLLLDLHPYFPPKMPGDDGYAGTDGYAGADQIPDHLLPYLKLIPQQLHIPQLYGQLSWDDYPDLWLLEVGSLPDPVYPVGDHVLPLLTQAWSQANALRQADWLWQIARLWEPLLAQGMASSLLRGELVQVNGPVVRLRELQRDDQPPTLARLGQAWAGLEPAAATWREFFKSLCHQLQTGAIADAATLIACLDGAIASLASAHQYRYGAIAQTDAGPTRDHNEDACHPDHPKVFTGDEPDPPAVIVCDGIGGHAGGEIASQIAIETIQQRLREAVASPDQGRESSQSQNSEPIQTALERAITEANDKICQRNDAENRQERERMGTTVVTAVAQRSSLYLGHVGDSRIYWITRSGCYQLSLDDDVAAREVRLGYAFYRDAVSFPGGGALIQALGMGPANRLYPNLDRLIIDEDSLILLCSDGLSDYDRIEQYWQTELLTVLQGQQDLATAVERLVAIANQKNGHDNVTVALLHCQVQPHPSPTLPPLPTDVRPPHTLAVTTLPSLPSSRTWPITALTTGIVALLLVSLGVVSYSLFPEWRQWIDRLTGNTPVTAVGDPIPLSQLNLGKIAQTVRTVELPLEPTADAEQVSLSPQTAFILTRRQTSANNGEVWLQLQLCSPTVNQPPIVWVRRNLAPNLEVLPLANPPRCSSPNLLE